MGVGEGAQGDRKEWQRHVLTSTSSFHILRVCGAFTLNTWPVSQVLQVLTLQIEYLEPVCSWLFDRNDCNDSFIHIYAYTDTNLAQKRSTCVKTARPHAPVTHWHTLGAVTQHTERQTTVPVAAGCIRSSGMRFDWWQNDKTDSFILSPPPQINSWQKEREK